MRRLLLSVGTAVVLAAGTAAAEDESSLEQRVTQLEKQNREIHKKLEQSESDNARYRRANLVRAVDDYLEMSSVDAAKSGLQTKKEAWLKVYGFIRIDVHYNTARLSHVVIPTLVRLEDGASAARNDDQFTISPRLSRIGFDFDFGQIGSSKVTGRIETDFQNFPSGVPESRETPRIRCAYIQIERGNLTLRIGQDWDIISPLYPSANFETLMWLAGNLGDRRPMIQLVVQSGGFKGTVALGLTGAVNNQDLDAGAPPFGTTERDGFDSGLPHVQVRGGYTTGSWVDGKELTVGAWGYLGLIETDTTFVGEDEFTSWVVGIDFSVPLAKILLLKGEAWIGQALGDIRGNIGLTINTALGREVEGWGGWIEIQVLLDSWQLHVGFTMDDPDDVDVAAGGTTRNLTAYFGVVRKLRKGFKTGLDIIFWETEYGASGVGNSLRFDLYIQIDF